MNGKYGTRKFFHLIHNCVGQLREMSNHADKPGRWELGNYRDCPIIGLEQHWPILFQYKIPESASLPNLNRNSFSHAIPPKRNIGNLQPDKNYFKAIIMTIHDRPKGFICFFSSKANYCCLTVFAWWPAHRGTSQSDDEDKWG
jgi:hypothetical protein